MSAAGTEERAGTPPALIAVAWLLVGLPLCWGVYRSAVNAAKLLHPQVAATK